MVVYDHLVTRLLRHARADAEKIDVGRAAPQPLEQEAISLLLAEKAREGRTVVRLKWGDPFVFDSGGKEALFLHEQGDPVRGRPRRSRRLSAVPAYAGIPLTYPGAGDTVTLCAGTKAETDAAPASTGRSLAALDGTLVCYAGAAQIAAVAGALLAHGRSPEEAAALIYRRDHRQAAHDRRARSARVAAAGRDRIDAGAARRRRGRRAAGAPPLVRRSPAVRQAHRRDAIARAGGAS